MKEFSSQAYDDAVNALYYEILSKTAPFRAPVEVVPPEEGRRTAELLPPIGINSVGLIALSSAEIAAGKPRALIQFVSEFRDDSVDSIIELAISDEKTGRIARSRHFDTDYHGGSLEFSGWASVSTERKPASSGVKGQKLGIRDILSIYSYVENAPLVEAPLYELAELFEDDEEAAA